MWLIESLLDLYSPAEALHMCFFLLLSACCASWLKLISHPAVERATAHAATTVSHYTRLASFLYAKEHSSNEGSVDQSGATSSLLPVVLFILRLAHLNSKAIYS